MLLTLSSIYLFLASIFGSSTGPEGVHVVLVRAVYEEKCVPSVLADTGGYPHQDAPCQRMSQNPDALVCYAGCRLWAGHSYCYGLCVQFLTACGLQPGDVEQDCLNFEIVTLTKVEDGICEGRPCKMHLAGSVTFIERCGANCNPKCCSSGSGGGYIVGGSSWTWDSDSPSFDWDYDVTAPCPSAANQEVRLEVRCFESDGSVSTMATQLRFWTCKGCN